MTKQSDGGKIEDGRFDNLICDHKGCGHPKSSHIDSRGRGDECQAIFFTDEGDYYCNCHKFKNNLMKFL